MHSCAQQTRLWLVVMLIAAKKTNKIHVKRNIWCNLRRSKCRHFSFIFTFQFNRDSWSIFTRDVSVVAGYWMSLASLLNSKPLLLCDMYTFSHWTIEMHKQWYAVYILFIHCCIFVEILGSLCLASCLYTTNDKKMCASFIFLNKARGWGKEKNNVWLEMGYMSALHRLLFNMAVWGRWFHFDVKRLV